MYEDAKAMLLLFTFFLFAVYVWLGSVHPDWLRALGQ